MASASHSIISASTCAFPSSLRFLKKLPSGKTAKFVSVRASSDSQDPDCNVEECAPEKEVGKVSMEWLAVEKTRVVGTFPPRRRGWTGYVEKDTAGQTNIYSIEPSIYVAESAISSGNAGTSTDGAENTAAIAAGLALIAIAAASTILIQVNKNPPQIQTLEYSGPSLSYYISKFKPPEIVEASVPTETEISAPVYAPAVSQDAAESNNEVVALDSNETSS